MLKVPGNLQRCLFAFGTVREYHIDEGAIITIISVTCDRVTWCQRNGLRTANTALFDLLWDAGGLETIAGA